MTDGHPPLPEILEILDHLPEAILCHDRSADPVFVYVNLTAASLWGFSRDEFLGLPSRLTAPDDHRDERREALQRVNDNGYTNGYTGVRCTATGRMFKIYDAEIWNVTANGAIVGQAARIPRWRYLSSFTPSHAEK